MTLSPQEARAQLQEIASYQQLSARLRIYRSFSPHLLGWGVIWLLGFGGMASVPLPLREWWWPAWVVIGLLASFCWARLQRRGGQARASIPALTTTLAVLCFVVGVLIVLPAHTGAQASALFPLLVALLYALLGIWGRAPRFLAIGAAIWALTLTGFFVAREFFGLWMALLGAGTLIGSGLWLRRV